MSNPLVSVIIPVFNSEEYIASTIYSLLDQTYTNFEIIAVDDCSKDNSYEILKSFTDNRLKVYRNGINLGIAGATNKAFNIASGKYIMQQDHDDISLKNRIELSVNFLENNPNIAGISGAEKSINGTVMKSTYYDNRAVIINQSADEVDCQQFFTGAFRNPTCMFRKDILNYLTLWYDENVKVSADMDFFERINAHGFKWVTIKNIVLLYRKHSHNATKTSKDIARKEFEQTVKKAIKRIMPEITEEEMQLHLKNSFRKGLFSKQEAKQIGTWYKKLINYNIEKKLFNHNSWLYVLSCHYMSAVIHSYIRSPFKAWNKLISFEELAPFYKDKRGLFLYEWQKKATKYWREILYIRKIHES